MVVLMTIEREKLSKFFLRISQTLNVFTFGNTADIYYYTNTNAILYYINTILYYTILYYTKLIL